MVFIRMSKEFYWNKSFIGMIYNTKLAGNVEIQSKYPVFYEPTTNVININPKICSQMTLFYRKRNDPPELLRKYGR